MTNAQDAPLRYHGVMVSSTFTDLARHRTAVIQALKAHGLTDVAMENDSAKPTLDVIDSSLHMVRNASAYICLISKKYGQTPVSSDRNPDNISITELEFNEALRLKRPILLFIMGDKHPIVEADIEINAAKRKKLSAFRERAKQKDPGSNVHRVYATFDSLEDFTSKIHPAIAELRRHIDESDKPDTPVPAAPAVHLPQRKALLVSRDAEIEALHQQLKEEGSLTYIPGIPGLGKTTLALEYAHRHQHDFESVHWLSCQQSDLAKIAGDLARQLDLKLKGDLDTVVTELKAHCARIRSLLIFDNVEDETPARLFPGGRSSVLITTRRTNLKFLRQHQHLELRLFTPEQCLQLFRKEIGQTEVDRHEAEAHRLFERLGYLPIGISVAASLIREDLRYTITSVAENLPADTHALLREAVAALTPSAQTLIAGMAACASEGFGLSLASEIAGVDEPTCLDVLSEIHSRSLVEELDRSARRYRLHALVREAAEATDDLRHKHAEALAKEFKNWETDWRNCEADFADWQTAFGWLLGHSDENAWSTVNSLAYPGFELTRRLGRLPEAFEICERMTREANLRNDKARLHVWYGSQALILYAWGRLDEALALHKKEEGICIELGDRDGLQITYGNQALILNAWGRLDEALALHKKKEAICIELGDRDGLSASYSNQAIILKDWGRLDEALDLHKKEEAICLELGNRNGLQASYGNQALILQAWGRLDEALDLHKKEEAICLELGNRNGLQASYGNQALILQAWGRLDEAMALHKKKEAICIELGNRDSLQITYSNQALILQDWGRLDEAMALLQKQEAICIELGNRDSLQRSYGNQAIILMAWGRLDEALALLQKQEAICIELGSLNGLQASYGNQALILRNWGRLNEALDLLQKQEAICIELGNRDSLQRSYGNQALILQDRGRLDEAMALHQKQEAICLELGNRDSLQRSYGNQALILQDRGRLDEAMALHQKQEAICLELGNRSGLAYCYWSWGLLASKQGDRDAELDKLKQALSIFTELKMPRERDYVQAQLNETLGNS